MYRKQPIPRSAKQATTSAVPCCRMPTVLPAFDSHDSNGGTADLHVLCNQGKACCLPSRLHLQDVLSGVASKPLHAMSQDCRYKWAEMELACRLQGASWLQFLLQICRFRRTLCVGVRILLTGVIVRFQGGAIVIASWQLPRLSRQPLGPANCKVRIHYAWEYFLYKMPRHPRSPVLPRRLPPRWRRHHRQLAVAQTLLPATLTRFTQS